MKDFFAHARFKVPAAGARNALSSLWRGLFAAAGRYVPLSGAESSCEPGDAVAFHGDIPVKAGAHHHQRRLLFVEPRPLVEEVNELVFTPNGASWVDGRLYERYSACRPGLRMLAGPVKPARELAEAYILQAEHSETFGDWFSEYLAPLARIDNIRAPVLLPKDLGTRAYVKRDAARFDIEFQFAEEPVLVHKAFVARQRRVIRYWREEDVHSLRRLLKASPPTPRPGSVLYLSRHGEVSEIAERSYPSEAIEDLVKARGGRVLRTAKAALEDYLTAAHDAETILYDHGSAAYNMVYWNPRRAIEFVSDDWWVNAFLFFADSIGVKDYTIICSDRGDVNDVLKRVECALDRPLGG